MRSFFRVIPTFLVGAHGYTPHNGAASTFWGLIQAPEALVWPLEKRAVQAPGESRCALISALHRNQSHLHPVADHH